MPDAIKQYLREVRKTHAAGNATEHSYRHALKALVESFGKGIVATNEPKRVKCGAPDFIVTRGDLPIGFIECKDVGVSLDEAEQSDQLKRYFDSLENLILTDYLEFRYYVQGRQEMHVVLARVDAKGKMKLMHGADEQVGNLFSAFFAAESAQINTPRELAARMAKIAQNIRDAIERAFALEGEAGTLHGEYESFRQTLLHNLTVEQFADMYAQTVCYGLFSARTNVPDQHADNFTREHAAYDLPKTNPFLRQTFDYIAGMQLDESIVWAVDLLAAILRRCNMNDVLKDFGKAGRKEDPVVHFYETFLAEYSDALRKTRGVYYTPEPVVSYIVRSIHAILKRDFDCPDGLADKTKISIEFSDPEKKSGKTTREVHRVQILDPAAGTGTFLFEAVRHIHDALRANRGIWAGERGYVAQHLLPRLYGFELMMAPYAVAHLKLGWLLKDTGYNFPSDERVRVYLTNTLEEAEIVAGPLLALANQIAREANAAGKVKTESPIMVVMGNPPYSGHSANTGAWSHDLIHKKLPTGAPGYFECDGKPLAERNPKWLNDDYVKFIRFAQYRIELTGYGVLGFITNNGYLDNPTFRGMRQSLMRTFDRIYVLDLHGSSKKKETAPDGSKDENVFDIQQGVAIGLFVKRKNGRGKDSTDVFHADLWGSRDDKYDWLNNHDITDTHWNPVHPQKPFHLFIPQNTERMSEYNEFWKITDVAPLNGTGVVTKRDFLSIDMDADMLWDRVQEFAKVSEHEARVKFALPGDVRDWQFPWAQNDVRESGPSKDCIQRILYRPFDVRNIYYTGRTRGFIGWPVTRIMRHMLAGENLGLCYTRPMSPRYEFSVSSSRMLIDQCAIGNKSAGAGISYLAPLYLYPGKSRFLESSPWPAGKDGRRPNLSPEFVEDFSGKLGMKFISDGRGDLEKTFGPEDVFHYAYAVFHSPTYRQRYAEILKIDFPRLPLTGDGKLFARLCELGAELVGLHLLERVPEPTATYPQAGSNKVTRAGTQRSPMYAPATDEHAGRVYINDEQYFENVPPEVWSFHVGGYQVCRKWLKDRKGRTLGYDDIDTYRNITEAIRETLRIMDEIDAAIPSWPIE